MTNGDITKRILKAAQVETGAKLFQTAANHMRRFPLSSEKLLYESDRAKVPAPAWEVLVRAAVQTDKEKLENLNAFSTQMGLEPETEFGRYTTK
jgi:hypothetical protein